MSSTAVEFGLINTLRSGNILIDTMLCVLVPLLIQRIVSHLQTSQVSMFTALYEWLFTRADDKMVTRAIEITQRFNQYGKVWDYEQKNHLLQKAISIYLSDVLDLKGHDAIYELLEKPKTKNKNKNKINEKQLGLVVEEVDDDGERSHTTETSSVLSDDGTSSEVSDESEDDTYRGEVDKLSVEAMPPMNQWVKVEEGVEFKHEIVTPENPGDKKGLTETKVNFRFQSSLPDGSARIDAFIARAFAKYQAIERKKHKEDKSRYFYIQSGTKASAADANVNTVAYKRYALGEEKTFENLFFDGKQQVLQLLDNFANRSGKFAIKGFPYKLGLLLHGPPGTGKTSLIKAVAQYTKRHIVTISLGKIKTNQELMDALFDLKFAVQGLDLPIEMTFKDVVFVMEDIDCASSVVNSREKEDEKPKKSATNGSGGDSGAKAEDADEKLMSEMIKIVMEDDKKKGDKLNLSGLLNVLDGVIDCPGRIVIMTTNHPEKLDPALIRPGRVNKKLLLSHMRWTHIQEMVEYYCQCKLSVAQMTELEETITNASRLFTPAEVEEVCAEHDELQEVLDGLRVLATPNES